MTYTGTIEDGTNRFDNVPLESKKNLSWQELKEEAKKMGLKNTVIQETCIEIDDELWFDCVGGFGISNGDGSYKIISNDRTPDQMLAIMKALQ